jgi:hypothetical protein
VNFSTCDFAENDQENRNALDFVPFPSYFQLSDLAWVAERVPDQKLWQDFDCWQERERWEPIGIMGKLKGIGHFVAFWGRLNGILNISLIYRTRNTFFYPMPMHLYTDDTNLRIGSFFSRMIISSVNPSADMLSGGCWIHFDGNHMRLLSQWIVNPDKTSMKSNHSGSARGALPLPLWSLASTAQNFSIGGNSTCDFRRAFSV